MNTLIVLILILAVVMAYAYYNVRESQAKGDTPRVPPLKKQSSYLLESRILAQMVIEKEIQKQHQARRKVTVHVEAHNVELTDLFPLLERLVHYVDFYFIHAKAQSEESRLNIFPKAIRRFTYKSPLGYLAIVRQLSADLHIETSAELIRSLKPFLPTILTTHDIISKQTEDTLSRGNKLKGYKTLREIFASLNRA